MSEDVEVGSIAYKWFAANTTAGAAGDGATPLFDVRKAGDAAGAIPTASGTPTLLTHANYTDGLYEIAIDTTGYAVGEYAVFCTLTISTVNPAGFVGSFKVVAVGDSLHSAAARIMDAIPNATAGASGGLFIAGSNAATTVATWTCTAASTNGSTVLGNTTIGTVTQTGAASWGATTYASMALTSGTIPADVQTVKARAVTDVGVGNTVYLGTSAWSTLTQTQVSGGAYDLTNSTFVAAFKSALGTVPASGNWATAGAQMDLVNAPNATAVTAIQSGLGTAANQATIAAYLDTEIAAILAAVDTEVATLVTEVAKVPKSDGTSSWNATALAALQSEANDALVAWGKTGFSLAAAGLDLVLVESGIVAGAGLTDDAGTQLTAINARQALAAALSALAAVLAGAATTTVTTKPAALPAGNTRISATVDADGNRSAITLKVPT